MCERRLVRVATDALGARVREIDAELRDVDEAEAEASSATNVAALGGRDGREETRVSEWLLLSSLTPCTVASLPLGSGDGVGAR